LFGFIKQQIRKKRILTVPLEERQKYSFCQSLVPKTRLAGMLLPIILLLLGGTVYGAGTLIRDKFFMPPGLLLFALTFAAIRVKLRLIPWLFAEFFSGGRRF